MSNKYIVLIVNHGNTWDTIECVQSLLRQSLFNLEIVIVDNSKDDSSFDLLKKWASGALSDLNTEFPHLTGPINRRNIGYNEIQKETGEYSCQNLITFIRASNNGFAAANNVGLRFIKKHNIQFDFIWFLNNDTVVNSNSIAKIDSYLGINDNCHIVGTSLYEYYMPGEIQSDVSGFDTLYFRTESFNSKKMAPSRYKLYPNGASFLLSKNFLQNVPELNEVYFLYFEEIDLVLRGEQYGYNCHFIHDELVYHKGGGSTGKNSELADFYYLRARFLFVSIFFPKRLFILCCFSFVMFPINRILRGQYKRIGIVLKAFVDFVQIRKGKYNV